MNSMVGQLHQDFSAIWVTNSGATAGAENLKDLSSEQIGVFPADDYCGGLYTATAEPSFKKNKRFFVAQGIAPFEGQLNPYSTRKPDFNRKSIEFTKQDIVGWSGQKAKKGAQTQAVAIGYDGINANKSLNAKLDVKPVVIRIILTGEPIRKFFGAKDAKIMREYTIDKGLCVSDCTCTDTCGKTVCGTIADGLINAIKHDKFNGQAISNFMRLSKIQTCETPPTPPSTTEYKEWTVTVDDDGQSSIGYLGAASGLEVTLQKREGIASTYSVWDLTSNGAPTNATITGSVIPDCGACPAGTTSVPEAYVYDVKLPAGVSMPTLNGLISSTKLGTDGTYDGYSVLIAKTWNHDADDGTTPEIPVDLADINAALEPVASTYTYMGLRTEICVNDTSTTLTWAASGELSYTTTKDYAITIGDTVCGTSRLGDIQAAYPDLTITEDATSSSCMHAFKTTTESNRVAPEVCDRVEVYEFTAPGTFDGIEWYDWTAVVQEDANCDDPAAPAANCCACGVVVEGAVFSRFYQDCTFGWYNWNPNDALPVKIQITAHSSDYTNNLCDESKNYVTVLRQATLNRGTSGEVVQEYERRNLLYENKRWEPNPYVNAQSGFAIIAKPYLMYDSYTLTLKRGGHDSTYILEGQNLISYTFYVKENGGKDLETLINKLIESTGNEDLKAVVL